MTLVFEQLRDNTYLFFNFLPSDWQEEIVPFWKEYHDSSKVYAIKEKNEILGGGIVFSKCPPDVLYFKNEADHWFNDGFLYIGFLYISEQRRNENLGSFWLDELKKNHPLQSFWLLIEEERLHRFYQRNNFSFVKTICYNSQPEFLYCYSPDS